MRKSQAWLSEASGVPRSTLSYVARGLRELPKQYSSSIRNVYQSEAYYNMKASGLSTTQANRFRWYSPETVLNVESTISMKINYCTLGAIGKKLQGLGRPATEEEVLSLWEEAHDAVFEGIQESKEPYEDIMKYGEKK